MAVQSNNNVLFSGLLNAYPKVDVNKVNISFSLLKDANLMIGNSFWTYTPLFHRISPSNHLHDCPPQEGREEKMDLEMLVFWLGS